MLALPVSPIAGQKLMDNRFGGQQWQLRGHAHFLGLRARVRQWVPVCRAGGGEALPVQGRAEYSQQQGPSWVGFVVFDCRCCSVCSVIDDFPCLQLSWRNCKLLSIFPINFFNCFDGPGTSIWCMQVISGLTQVYVATDTWAAVFNLNFIIL